MNRIIDFEDVLRKYWDNFFWNCGEDSETIIVMCEQLCAEDHGW